ncbi:hypothetical protein PGB90_005504 [Kerria lacca]
MPILLVVMDNVRDLIACVSASSFKASSSDTPMRSSLFIRCSSVRIVSAPFFLRNCVIRLS